MNDWSYGATHQESAAIAKLCNRANPSARLSESAALGFAGGLAFGYFTFEYKGELPNLYIGTMNWWHDLERFFGNAARGAGCAVERHAATTINAATNRLNAALEQGEPAIVAMDARAFEEEAYDPASQGRIVYPIITAVDGDNVVLDYLENEPRRLSRDIVDRARSGLKRARFEFFTVSGEDREIDAGDLFRTSLQEQTERPLDPGIAAKGARKRIGLDGLQLLLTALKGSHKHSWAAIGDTPEAFRSMMRQLKFWIAEAGTGGDGLRSLYAAFINDHTQVKAHDHAAEVLQTSATHWQAAATVAEDYLHLQQTAASFEKERDEAIAAIRLEFEQIFEQERHAYGLLAQG